MASYKQACEWIATNDDTSEIETGDIEEIEMLAPVTVVMIADLWNKSTVDVIKEVRRALKRNAK